MCTQKNHLNETVLLSTQNIGKKIFTILCSENVFIETCAPHHHVFVLYFQKYPQKKGFIRGISYLTGYVVRQLDAQKCQFTYVSQSDPRGE